MDFLKTGIHKNFDIWITICIVNIVCLVLCSCLCLQWHACCPISVQKAKVCFRGQPLPTWLSGAHQKPQRNVLHPFESGHVVSSVHTSSREHSNHAWCMALEGSEVKSLANLQDKSETRPVACRHWWIRTGQRKTTEICILI